MTQRFIPAILPLLAACALGGCGREEPEAGGIVEGDRGPLSEAGIREAADFKHPLAEAYYKEHPEFFRFASPDDLPDDLKWEDGLDQPDIGSPNAKKGGEVTFWIDDFPRTLRYTGPDANGSFRRFIHDDNNLCVVKKHPATGNYMGGTAKEWAISEDRLTVYFRLDPEVRYSDGVPVDADDYFFLMYFGRSPWVREPWNLNWYNETYTHITRYDDHTIAIGVAQAKPDTLRLFEEDVRPIPPHFYKDFGEDYVERYQWALEPTTGPYTIYAKDISKGRSIVQTKVKDWWAADRKFFRYRFNPQTRRFTVVRDPDKALESFKAAQFDMFRMRTPELWHDKLPDSDPLVQKGYIHKAQFYNEVPRPTYGLRINTNSPPLDNRDIRIGLHHAMNWDRVLNDYFRGDFERMRTSADGFGKFTHPDLQPRGFSVEKALESFAKAGYTERGSDGILRSADGDRLSFTVTTGYKRLEDVLTILEQEARKAGVELKLEVLEQTAGWKKAQEKNHEIALTALNTSVEMYPRYFDFFHSWNAFSEDGSVKTHTNNMTMTADSHIDSLIERYDSSTGVDEIRSLAHQIEDALYEEASFIPGFVQPYYRVAFWRWVKWPAEFDYRLSRDFDEFHVYWIDEDARKRTVEAMKKNQRFEPGIRIYDQHKSGSSIAWMAPKQS